MSGTLVLILRLGIALALYAFLGWALFTIWRDVRDRGFILSERKVPILTLAVHYDNHDVTQRAFTQTDITLGRDPACDLSINDDAVSARHARLRYHHGQWWAEDLGSTNGTRLNQSRLSAPTVLISGDQVECGHTALIVSIGGRNETSPTVRLK